MRFGFDAIRFFWFVGSSAPQHRFWVRVGLTVTDSPFDSPFGYNCKLQIVFAQKQKIEFGEHEVPAEPRTASRLTLAFAVFFAFTLLYCCAAACCLLPASGQVAPNVSLCILTTNAPAVLPLRSVAAKPLSVTIRGQKREIS